MIGSPPARVLRPGASKCASNAALYDTALDIRDAAALLILEEALYAVRQDHRHPGTILAEINGRPIAGNVESHSRRSDRIVRRQRRTRTVVEQMVQFGFGVDSRSAKKC